MTIQKLLGKMILVIIVAIIPIIISQEHLSIVLSFSWAIIILYFFWPITKRRAAKRILRGRNHSSRKNVWLSRYKLRKITKKNCRLKVKKSDLRWYIVDGWQKKDSEIIQDIGNDLILVKKHRTKRL